MSSGPSLPGGQAVPQQTNWLSEWSERTPLVTRWTLFIIIPVTLISLLAGGSGYLSLIPYQTLGRGEVWRFFTCFFDQGGIFTVLFVVLMFATQMPAQEYRMGSLPFLFHLISLGMLINLIFVSLSMLFFLIPWGPIQLFAFTSSQGLWPILMTIITNNALMDPTGSTPFLCFTFNNRMYPWFLVGIFSLISFFPLLDLIIGVCIGHLYNWGYLARFKLSARRIQAIETNGGLAARTGMTTKLGYVYGPDTVIPPGARVIDREAAAAQWAMFDPIARRRLQEQQQQRQNNNDGNSGEGDEEDNRYMYRAGTRRPGNTNTTGTGGTATTSTAFSGQGRALGSDNSTGSVSSTTTTTHTNQPSVTNMLASLMNRGSSSVPSAPPLDSLSGSSNNAAAEERRRAMAAAAEARLQSLQKRGNSTTTVNNFESIYDNSNNSSVNPIAAPVSARSSVEQTQTGAQTQPHTIGITQYYANDNDDNNNENEDNDDEHEQLLGSSKTRTKPSQPTSVVVPVSTIKPIANTNSSSSSTPQLAGYAAAARLQALQNKNRHTSVPAPAPVPVPDSAALVTLIDMGFDRNKAIAALQETNNDLEDAVVRLSSD